MTIARVLRAWGRRGEVAAELHSSSVERFAQDQRMFALQADHHRRELALERAWAHKGQVVLKFRGVDSISQAEALSGCEIQVPRAERIALTGGEFYVSDLLGCAIFDRGAQIGKISDVQFGAGDAPLLVVKAGNKGHLLPFAEAYLKQVEIGSKRIEMELPEGMLQLSD